MRSSPYSAGASEAGVSRPRTPLRRLVWRAAQIGAALLLAALPGVAQKSIGEQLSDLLLAQQSAQGPLSPTKLAEGNQLIDALSAGWPASPETQRSYAASLLRFMGRARDRAWSGSSLGPRGDREADLAARARGTLRLRANVPLLSYLTGEVLLMPRLHSADLRAGAALLLGDFDTSSATLALLQATRDPDRHVRDCAVEALTDRDSPTVHAAFIELLREVERGDLQVTTLPIERHLKSFTLTPGGAAEAQLFQYVRGRLPSSDWHLASRAIAVSRALSDRRAAPPLIEAMSVWLTRQRGGLQSARMLGDLEAELERRSGRKMGQDPQRWRSWWRAVRAGEAKLPSEAESGGRTMAAFFGLRPETDRVVFVLDRSGSMDAAVSGSTKTAGSKSRTRFDEAGSQLIKCLEGLGEGARFDVILFSDDLRRFRKELVPANEKNLKNLARWISLNGPDGGTRLLPGVMDAMSISEPAALEADTVIVLCDGETAEGPTWVGPFLRAQNDLARVRFHAVQLGGRSDGTLESLCRHSGGDYVEIDLSR